ncbi:membrane hypothetical protein [Candidatus Zixiibacteriota bacterium]|nr:membrane hypothetical protein [candidate division Zixibacteria bacterium]
MKSKIFKIASGLTAISLAVVRSAGANTGASGTFSVGAIVNLIVLVCAVIGLLWGIKVLSLVKGGLMSKGWQMFILGFGFLILAELVILAGKFHLAGVPDEIPAILYLLMAATWLAGINQTRKVLE